MFEVRTEQHKAEWDNPFPSPTGSAGLISPQGTVSPFGCQGTLLSQIHLATNQSLKASFCGAPLKSLVPKSSNVRAILESGVESSTSSCSAIGDGPSPLVSQELSPRHPYS